MARRTFTPDEIAEWVAYRNNGEHTIEETALHFGVATETIRKYTPKGIKNEQRKGQKGNMAKQRSRPSKSPDPNARIAHPTVARRFR